MDSLFFKAIRALTVTFQCFLGDFQSVSPVRVRLNIDAIYYKRQIWTCSRYHVLENKLSRAREQVNHVRMMCDLVPDDSSDNSCVVISSGDEETEMDHRCGV